MVKLVTAASVLAVAGAASAQTLAPGTPIFNLADGEVTRDFGFMQPGARNLALDVTGNDFTQVTTGFNTDATSGQFEDDFPDDFVFGSAGQDAGAHLRTGAPTQLDAIATPIGGGLVELSFVQSTVDGSDIFPAGNAPDGSPLDLLVFEMGQSNAASQFTGVPIPLTNSNGNDFKIVDARALVFVGGSLAADFDLTMDAMGNPREIGNLPALDVQSAIGGAAGAGVTGHGVVWTVQIPTPGAAALFGVAGLAAVRRHR